MVGGLGGWVGTKQISYGRKPLEKKNGFSLFNNNIFFLLVGFNFCLRGGRVYKHL